MRGRFKKSKVLLGLILGLGGITIFVYSVNIVRIPQQSAIAQSIPDILVYPGAALQDYNYNAAEKTYIAHWMTTKSVPEVMNWYITNIPITGWKYTVHPGNPQSQTVQYAEFQKANNTFQLSVVQQPENRGILIEERVVPPAMEGGEETQ